MKMTGTYVGPKKEVRKLWSLLPPERRLSKFPQVLPFESTFFSTEPLGFFRVEVPGVASVTANTFLSRSSTDRPSRPGNFIAFSKFGHCSRSEYYLIAPSGSTRGILMVNHWRIHSLTSKVSLIFLLYTLFVIWKVFYVEFLSEIPRAMSLNRQVLVVTMTLMSHKFLLKGSWGAGVCCWDYFGALMWYRVEEIFVAPDIVNPLSISVQANGLKRDLFWIWGMLICIYLNRSLQSRVPFSKVILLFPLIWKQAITILIFFRIVTNIWLFRGILAQGMSDIFNLRFCLLCFLVHLLLS